MMLVCVGWVMQHVHVNEETEAQFHGVTSQFPPSLQRPILSSPTRREEGVTGWEMEDVVSGIMCML